MAKKATLREWTGRLETILRENGDEDVGFDPDLAANYWREGHSPREFYREVVAGGEEEDTIPGGSFDPRWEL